MKSLLVFSILFSLVFITSCSGLIEGTRKTISGDEERQASPKSAMISRQQYDDLLDKYKNLVKEHESLKEGKLTTGEGPSIVDEMSKSTPSVMAETVDVFGKTGPASHEGVDPSLMSEDKVNSSIEYYKRAVVLKETGKLDAALKVFQQLEHSDHLQIRVRASNHIGQIYIQKNQFDLALQVYEKILDTSAYSGIVLEALRGAAMSSKMLGLEDKKLKYTSMMNDVFGSST